MEPIVFVVDDDPAMRNSLRLVMESARLRVETFASAEEFLKAGRGDELACLVLDLRLTGMSGLELLELLRAQQRLLPVVMITGHGDVPAAVRSMKLGAVDFYEKPVDPRALVSRVQAALEQDKLRREKQNETEAVKARMAKLTARERELLKLLVEGLSSKMIAEQLNLSQKTVENHRSRLLAKTGAHNAADLVRLSMLAGLS